MNEKLTYVVPIDENGDIIPPQHRAPAENMVEPQGLAPRFDGNGTMVIQNTTIQPPAFYETPLFIGAALFFVLLLIFIGVLSFRNKRNKK